MIQKQILRPERLRQVPAQFSWIDQRLVRERFSCEYIANLLEQQARPLVEPGALHLTRQQDLLDLELPAPDLSLYSRPEGGDA